MLATLVGLLSTPGLSLIAYYLFFAMPSLMLAAAFFLHRGSRWVLGALGLVPIAFVLMSVYMAPELAHGVSRSLGSYLNVLPTSFKVSPLFSVGCFVYCLFLQKWGHIA